MQIEPIKTALCSFGMSGKLFHAPFIAANPNYILYGCWERSTKLIEKVYPNVKSYDNYEELLSDNEVELVIVNTPNLTHYPFAKQALLAGKHVIVEKPFTVTVEQAEELIAIAKEQNKQLGVYQNRRYDSDFLSVKSILDQGLLGEIVEAEIHFDRYVETLSYKVHKETPVTGVGILYDLGSHIIDQATQLFGTPTHVFADIRIVRPISKVDDYFEVLLYYPNNRVRLKATYVAREQVAGYIIHGSKGSFLKPKTNIQEEALLANKPLYDIDWGKEEATSWGILHTSTDGRVVRHTVESLQGNYMDYFENVFNAIRHNEALPVKPEEAALTIKIIHACFESSNTKQVIKLA